MIEQDVKKVVKNLRDSGYSDKQIAKSFTSLFVTGKISIEVCAALLGYVGYHIPEEVLVASHETQIELAKKILEE